MNNSTQVCCVRRGGQLTLSLCFRGSKLPLKSLRAFPQEAWEEVLQLQHCEIVSAIETGPVECELRRGKKVRRSHAITAYILTGEGSLFLTDTTVTLKLTGRQGQHNPLAVVDSILDLAAPGWREKHPSQYLSYAMLAQPGYPGMADGAWESQVAFMQERFQGDGVTLGSAGRGIQCIYVASYVPKGEIRDVFSTEVVLSNLAVGGTDTIINATDNDDGLEPLKGSWRRMHGDEPRSITAAPKLHGHFSENKNGYIGNGVFGHHFTTMRVQAGHSATISVETTLPLASQAKRDFIAGVEQLCSATTIYVTEFALTPTLLPGTTPDVVGFELVQSSRTTLPTFACAYHCFKRPCLTTAVPQVLPFAACGSSEPKKDIPAKLDVGASAPKQAVAVPVQDASEAPVRAAEQCLASQEENGKAGVPAALLDISVLKSRAELWRSLLPRVEPFYAVKCNSEPAILETLWETWQQWGYGGFDCASPAEMKLVLPLESLDAEEDILYANPCKHPSAIQFASDSGVKRIVFDNHMELDKLASIYPTAELILRVQTDDSFTQCPLSNKFGAPVDGCKELLAHAKTLGLQVVGVSFHVGSGCSEVGAFRGALLRAKAAWDEADAQGFEMTFLDIGGGFPGWDEEGQASFAEHASDINLSLKELFPSKEIRVVAEPGRFFAAPSEAVLTTVTSIAEFPDGNRYYLNDGLYGSFNCLLYDHATVPMPTLLRSGKELMTEEAGPTFPCTVFGPTCDGLDMISNKLLLPKLEVGDNLLFPNMGAYTTSASTFFNGFCPAEAFVYEAQLPMTGVA